MDELDFIHIGKILKLAREKSCLTQVQVADAIGISTRHLQDIENTGKIPGTNIFYKLTKMYHLSADALFHEKVHKSEKRIQIDSLLDTLSDKELLVVESLINAINEYRKSE